MAKDNSYGQSGEISGAVPGALPVGGTAKPLSKLVVIDTQVAGWQNLEKNLTNQAEILVLQPDSDGIAQITAHLKNRRSYDLIAILSEGSEAAAYLGDSCLNSRTLTARAEEVGSWGDSLNRGGDIAFFGCKVGKGAAGLSFVRQFATLTGADVAASDDLTGPAHLGGDTDLEVRSGSIEADLGEFRSELANLPAVLDEFTTDPTVNTPANQATNEDVPFTFGSTVVVSAPNSSRMEAVVSVTSGSGVISDGEISDVVLASQGNLAGITAFLNSLNYVPTAQWNGTATITVTITSDYNNRTAGNTETRTFNVTVSPVNDAPVASGAAPIPSVTSGNEDTPSASIPNGTVTSLFGSKFSDSDDAVSGGSSANSFAGVAVVSNAVNAAQGNWQYSTDGTNWTNISARGASNALLLRTTDYFRYQPAANWFGTPAALSVRLIDSSGSAITAGTTVDLSAGGATGGATRYSAGTVSLTTSVLPVNDNPVTSNFSFSVTKNTPGTTSLTSTDVDTGTNSTTDAVVNGYRIVTIPANGTLRDSDGVTMTAGANITIAKATNMTFTPTTNYTGADSFTFRAVDAAGALSTTSTATITVTTFNEPPVLTVPGSQTVAEDGSVGISGISLADVDAGSTTVQIALSVSQGTINMTPTTGLTLQSGAYGSAAFTVRGTMANLNARLANLVYTPTANYNGPDALVVTANDLDAGGAKTDTKNVSITVTSVPDRPVTGAATLAAINEDTFNPAGAVVSALLTGYSDLDSQALGGVAISADGSSTSTQGAWQYSVSNGATWSAVGTVSTTSALLIPANAKLRFVPVANYFGTPGTLTLYALDNGGSRTFTTNPASRQTINVTVAANDLATTSGALTTTVNPVNDVMTVVSSFPLAVNEGGSTFLGSTILNITDLEASASQIVYTVVAAGTNLTEGTMQLDTTGSGNWVTMTTGTQFTQAQISANRLRYVHNGTEPTVPQVLAYTVTDNVAPTGGTTLSRTLQIDVSPVNDAPQLYVPGQTPPSMGTLVANVAKGGTLTFSIANIFVLDTDNSDEQLVFRLESLPVRGELRYDGGPVGIGSVFSYANLGLLQYVHNNGTETADAFNITLRDGAGGLVNTTAVNLVIGRFNTPPIIDGRAGILERDTDVTLALNIADGQTAVNNLTIRILSLPAAAEATLKFNGVAITPAQVSSGFDIPGNQRHLLTISHISTNRVNPPDVSFNVRVTDNGYDGGGFVAPMSSTATIDVDVRAVDDEPTVVVGSLNVPTRGSSVTVTDAQLDASDVDTAANILLYRVDTRPVNGTLRLSGVPLGVGATFTQDDVDSGRLTYRHRGSATTTDSFVVTLRDQGYNIRYDRFGGVYPNTSSTTLSPLTVNVTIAPSGPVTGGGGGSQSGSNGVVPIDAWDDEVETNKNVAATINQSVLLANDGGTTPFTIVSVNNAVNGTVALNAGVVTFTPTHNFAGVGSFDYIMRDNEGRQDTAHVDVIVYFVNYAPALTTNNPLVLNEEATATISSSILAATDVDSTNQEVFFVISSLPTNGTLYYDPTPANDVSDATALLQLDTFTQAEINAGNIKFQHDGTEDFLSQVGLALSDGGSDPILAVLQIDVTPVNDAPVLAVTGFDLDEDATAIVDTDILSVSDVDGDGDDKGLSPDTLTYSIANAGHLPTHGALRLDSDNNGSFETVLISGSTFTPAQVAAGRLQYDNDGSEYITDAFTVTVNDGKGAPNSVVTGTVNIGIIPINDDPVVVNNTGMTINEGAKGSIITARLSGSDPDNTNTQIQFRITTNTAHGSLYRGTTLLGVGSAITMQQILDNEITYVHDGLESIRDSFFFRLSDGGGGNEPAGEFVITLTPVNDAPVVQLPGDHTAVEGVSVLISTIVIEDPDSVNLSGVINSNFGPIQVTLTAANGTLDVTASGAAGVTGDGTDTIVITGRLGDVNATLASLRYTSDGDFNGADTITVVANDQGNSGTGTPLSDTEVLDINVRSVNDAPVIARPATQSVNEDTNLVFSTGNGNAISFNDVDIGTADAAVSLTVTNGTITLGSTTGLTGLAGNGSNTITFNGSQSEFNAALQGLVFRASADYHGSATLTIAVNDLGNTGDISEPLSDIKTVAITVNPVNDAPVTAAQNITINEDATGTLSLQSTDVDSNQGGNNTTNDAIVNRYRIVTIPSNGTLRDNGGTVMSAGALITTANATNMSFVPSSDYNGTASFTFRAVDAAGSEGNISTFTVNITAVNDSPVLAGAGDTVNFTEGSGAAALGTAVRLDGNGNFALSQDIELTVRSEDNFAGSFVSVYRQGGAVATDRMGLDTAYNGDGATVAVAGANVSYNATLIGTITDNSSASGNLVITFNSSATQAAVSAVLKRLTFNSVDDALNGAITVVATFNDGNAAVASGAQGTGGAGAANGTFTVNVNNVNDAPRFTNNGAYGVAEDVANPTGASIDALMAANFFDYDAGAIGAGQFAGVAITADASNQTTQGRWQYSANSGVSWSDVTPLGTPAEAPSGTQALLLSKATLLRFIPVANFNDRSNKTTSPAGALTVVAVDSSGARTYTTAALKQFVNTVLGWTDVSDIGSATPAYVNVSVSQVNDTPVLSNLHNDHTGFIEAVGVNIAGTATILDEPATGLSAFADIDLTTRVETTFNGATLSVQQKSSVDTYDFFVPQTGGGITLSGAFTEPGPGLKLFNNGSLIRYNGTTFATITDNSDVSGRLLITFNQNATKAAMDALLQNLVYSNNNPTIIASNKTITITFTDGNGNTNNAQGTGGALSTSADVIITITPTNDSPAFTEGVTIGATEDISSTPATVGGLLLAKFIDLDALPSDLAGIAISGYTEAGRGTWQVNWGGGWVPISTLATNAGGISEARALMLSVDTQIQFVPAANANTAGPVARPYLTVYAVEDAIPVGAPDGHLPYPLFTSNAASPVTFNTTTDNLDSYVSELAVPLDVTISPRNDAPTFAGGTAFTGTLLESPILGTGTSLQQLLTGVSIADVDLATTGTLAATNFGAGSITVSITGGVTGDTFTVAGSPAGVSGATGGTNGSNLVINLSNTTTLAQLNAILEAIRYQHTTDEPPSGTRSYTVTLSDGNNTDAQGDTAGGPLAYTAQIVGSLTLTAANDPPQLTATPRNPTHVEGDPASVFYASANTNPTGTGQNIVEARFTISNLSNGTDEKLTIDGTEITLTDGTSATTATNTGTVTVTVVGNTATVVYTKAAGLNAAATNTLINSLAYRNSSDAPTAGPRTLTIAFLQDSGGTADNGEDTNASLGVTASVVTVEPRNDAPTIVGVMTNPTATENAGAGTGVDPVTLLSAGSLSDVDGAPANMGLGAITVSFASYVTGDIIDIATGVGHAVNAVQLSGSNVQISNGAAWTTIGTVDGTNNGQGRALVINLNSSSTENHIGPVLNAIRYRSTSDNPTTNNTATTRTYSFIVNDGNNNNTAGGVSSLNSNTLTGGTLTITPVNDIPVVDLNGAGAGVNNAVTWNEVANGTHVAANISSAGTYTDPDNTNLTQMVMTVTGVLNGNSERLIIGGTAFPLATAATNTVVGSFRVSYNNATGVFTIIPNTGSVALLTAYQTLLNGITYNSTTDNPTAGDRAIAINITDAGLNNNSDGNNLTSVNATTTITVVPTNDQPVLSGLNAATFYEHAVNAAAATIDSDITLTDIDSSNYAGGTLTVSGLVASQDVVSLPTGSAAVNGSVRANGSNVEYHNGSSWNVVGAFSGGSGANFVVSLNASATASITERIIEHLRFANTSLAPTTSRTLTLATNDGDGNPVQNATVGITILLDNDAPVLGATVLGVTYAEQSAATAFVGGTISVTDPDANANFYNSGANIGSLTAALDGYVAGDTLSVAHAGTGAGQIGVSGGNISYAGANFASFTGGNAANLVITFTSNAATPAAVQALIAQLRYSNAANNDPTVNNTDPSRVFTVTLNDGANTRDATSATTTLTGTLTGAITITPSNDLPVVTPAVAAATYVERASALTVDNTTTVTDSDDTQIASATVSITSNFTSLDTLAASAAGLINVSYVPATGVLNLSGTDTLANYQTVLRSVTFSSTSNDPTVDATRLNRVLTYALVDANSDGAGAATGTATKTINITAINSKPVLTAGATLAYTEQAAAAAIDNTITVNDVDDTQIVSARVTISSGRTAGDVLAFVSQNGITGNYVPGTGVLTLTGTTTLANYQAALRSVTFNSTSDHPTATSTSRTITWEVTDANSDQVGAEISVGVTSTINITPVNDAPVNTLAATVSVFENNPLAFTGLNTISAADPDLNLATTQLTVTHGTLTVTLGGGATISSGLNGSATLTLSGTETQISAALATLIYQPALNYNGPDVLTVASTDGGTPALVDTDNVLITVTPVNSAPAGTNGSFLVIMNSSYTLTAANFGFTDPEDTPPNAFSRVRITTLPEGTLTNNGAPVTAGSFVTVANIDAGLLIYTPTVDEGGTAYTSFTFQVEDDGGTANGGVNLDASPNTLVINVSGTDPQHICFCPPTKASRYDTVTLTATASSGLPVIFQVASGPGSITGNTLTFSGAGAVVVKARQFGDATYAAAPDKTETIQVLNFYIPPDVADGWTVTYGGEDDLLVHRDTDGKAMAMQVVGNFAVSLAMTGSTTNDSGDRDIYTAKYDAESGEKLWTVIHGGEANAFDEGSAAAMDSAGNVWITGLVTNSAKNTDLYVAKYASADGALLWEKTFRGANGTTDTGNDGPGGYSAASPYQGGDFRRNAIALTPDGGVVITGYITKADKKMDAVTLKYDANGNLAWYGTYNGPSSGSDYGQSVAVDSVGNVFVSGASVNANIDALTMKYNGATGARIWDKIYDGGKPDSAVNLKIDADGHPVISGYSQRATFDFMTARYDSADGTLIWMDLRDGPTSSSDMAWDFALTDGTRPIVTGTSYPVNGIYDGYTFTYNCPCSTDPIAWAQRYEGPASRLDQFLGIGTDMFGNPIVTGFSQNANGTYDTQTVKYKAADGTILWSKRYNGAADGTDLPRQILVDPAGNVFIAGFTTTAGGTTDSWITRYVATEPSTSANQVITFLTPPSQGVADFLTLNATASSGLPVEYEVVSGPAYMEDNVVGFMGFGSVTIRASQPGDSTYNAAVPVERTFTVGKSRQVIVFTLPETTSASEPIVLNGESSSTLPITYTVVSGPATLSGSTLTFTGPGVVKVRASQAGDIAYLAASSVERAVTVEKGAQTIDFTLPTHALATDVVPLTATASSDLPITYSIVSGPGAVSGGVLTFTGAGSVSVRASQSGDNLHGGAAAVTRSITVKKASQTIAFTLPSDSNITDTLTLAATSSSGLPVTYTVAGPGRISGNVLSFTGSGVISVRATQVGNALYLPATMVNASVKVVLVNPVLAPITLEEAYVGQIVEHALDATHNPARYTATGLPPGIKLNVTTGVLSGTPTAAKMVDGEAVPYIVTFTASNASGVSNTVIAEWNILPMGNELVGAFNGLTQPSSELSLNNTQTFNGLGGAVSVTTTKTGTYTGKVVVDTVTYALSGKLAVNAEEATGTCVVKRKDSPSLTVSFGINAETGELTGTLTDGLIDEPLALNAWRNTWHATSNPAADYVGSYTSALEIDPSLQGESTYPQGNGYGTLKITAAGVATWSGKLADGTATTASTTTGPHGEIALHIPLYTPAVVTTAGALNGWVRIEALEGNTLTGPLSWKKNPQAANSTTRSYKNGFPSHQILAMGGKYMGTPIVLPPSENGSPNNALLTFSDGGIENAAYTQDTQGQLRQAFRLLNGRTVTMPTGLVNNPATVRLTLNATTGLFTGSFTLKDADPTDTVPPIAVITRTVSYAGVMVPMFNQGVGHFVLPQLPSTGNNTTATTSPQMSGQVLLESNTAAAHAP